MTTFEIVKLICRRLNHHPYGEGMDGTGNPRTGWYIAKGRCPVSGKKATMKCPPSGDLLCKTDCPLCDEMAVGDCDICGQEPD